LHLFFQIELNVFKTFLPYTGDQSICRFSVGYHGLGKRFRFAANVVDDFPTDAPLPKLPIARLVAAASEPKYRRGSLDLCGGSTSHQLQLFGHCGTITGLR